MLTISISYFKTKDTNTPIERYRRSEIATLITILPPQERLSSTCVAIINKVEILLFILIGFEVLNFCKV